MKQMLIILFFSVILISCGDRYAYYSTFIDNQTTDTITFYWKGQTKYMQGNLDSVICLPDSNTKYIDVLGRFDTNFTCRSAINEAEVRVVVSSGKTLVKEIWDSNNWSCSGNNEIGWKIMFIITEEDLE